MARMEYVRTVQDDPEVQRLRTEVESLKSELKEIKDLLKGRPSFTDFKVFKFNEEEEIRKQQETVQQETVQREQLERLRSLYTMKSIR